MKGWKVENKGAKVFGRRSEIRINHSSEARGSKEKVTVSVLCRDALQQWQQL